MVKVEFLLTTSKPSSQNWFKIGIVGKPHGIRGAFFIAGRQEAVPRDYKELILGEDPGSGRSTRLTSSGMSQGRPVVTCDACASRDAAEALRGIPVWVDSEAVKVDEESEYLWSELVGRAVLDAGQVVVGTVLRICNYGTTDIVVLGNAEKGELEIPLVGTYFDMKFKRTERHLRLIVAADTFAGLWTGDTTCESR